MELDQIKINISNALEMVKKAEEESYDVQAVYFLMGARNALIKSANDMGIKSIQLQS